MRPSSEKDLHVLSVTAFESYGGAERVAASLHTAYLTRTAKAWLAIGRGRTGAIDHSMQIPNDELRGVWAHPILKSASRAEARSSSRGDAFWALSRALRFAAEPIRWTRVLSGHEDFDHPGTRRLLQLTRTTPDILHLHNLHGGYFDIRELPRLSRAVPTVLTLHDAWLLTGHCAHPFDCQRFTTGCGSCPYPDVYVPMHRDASKWNWRVKRRAVEQSRLYLATPSEWLMRLVQESGVSEGVVESRIIPNGVDTEVFSPGETHEARDALRLPHDKTIVLFVAQQAEGNPFKDLPTLMAALQQISNTRDDLMLVALGGAEGSGRRVVGHGVISIPFIDDPQAVAKYQQAADLYVHAARAENMPLAPIEAMACGTPVVATAIGGLPEIIDDGRTGVLTPPQDPVALADAIASLIDDPVRLRSMGDAARRKAVSRFDIRRQVDAYLSWFVEILGESCDT